MVGDGSSLYVWSSPWLVDGDRMRIPLMKNTMIDLNLKVNSLILDGSQTWNQTLLDDLFLSSR